MDKYYVFRELGLIPGQAVEITAGGPFHVSDCKRQPSQILVEKEYQHYIMLRAYFEYPDGGGADYAFTIHKADLYTGDVVLVDKITRQQIGGRT